MWLDSKGLLSGKVMRPSGSVPCQKLPRVHQKLTLYYQKLTISLPEVDARNRIRYQVQQEELSMLQKLRGWHRKLMMFQKSIV